MLINYSSYVLKATISVAFLFYSLQKKQKDFKIMVTNYKRRPNVWREKSPVTLLVDDVKTANELIKLASAAKCPCSRTGRRFK